MARDLLSRDPESAEGSAGRQYHAAVTEFERKCARVPVSHIANGVRWLILEFDSESNGWFLFMYRERFEPSVFDEWHLTRDEALQSAESQWGIESVAWSDL